MTRARLFAVGVLVQAAFGVLAVIVTRWSFRSWPAGSYTWIPAILGLVSVLVVVGLGYALAARGLPLVLIASAWLLGRLAGVLASALIPGVGIDSALLAAASFGLLVGDAGRVTLGAPSLGSLLGQLALLSLAYLWGRRHRMLSNQRIEQTATR